MPPWKSGMWTLIDEVIKSSLCPGIRRALHLDFPGQVSVTSHVWCCFVPPSYPIRSAVEAESHACLILLTCSDCVNFVVPPGVIRHLLNYFILVFFLSEFIAIMSNFVVLYIQSMHRVFYYENWRDSLCHSCFWLPAWIELICTARYSVYLFPSKNRLDAF